MWHCRSISQDSPVYYSSHCFDYQLTTGPSLHVLLTPKLHCWWWICRSFRYVEAGRRCWGKLSCVFVFSSSLIEKELSLSLYKGYTSVTIWSTHSNIKGFPGGSVVKDPLANARDTVRSLVLEDPTHRGAAKSMCHNCWAYALEPWSCNYWNPEALEPVLCNRRSHCYKPVHSN